MTEEPPPRELTWEQERALKKFVYKLLKRVHENTDCGRDGKHWPECDAVRSMFGYSSWEEWDAFATVTDIDDN